MKRQLRIIYMGTPEFAVEPLRVMIESGYNVVGVITAPDKPAGRGQKLHCSPVKEYALSQNLTILQPEKLKNPDFLQDLKQLNANLQIVVAFRMLPAVVWQMPEFGTFNLHASLLPQYRGAAPINHAIINGETETGITTFFIEEEIDTGNILLSHKEPILPADDAGALHDRLMLTGGKLVLETIKMIESGDIKTQSQSGLLSDQSELKPAPKIFRDDCRINWSESGLSIHNRIRGLSPFPGAFSELVSPDGMVKQMKIFKTVLQSENSGQLPGTIITDGRKVLMVTTGDGVIGIEELQLEGKKRMNVAEFLRGIAIHDGFLFK